MSVPFVLHLLSRRTTPKTHLQAGVVEFEGVVLALAARVSKECAGLLCASEGLDAKAIDKLKQNETLESKWVVEFGKAKRAVGVAAGTGTGTVVAGAKEEKEAGVDGEA